MISFFLYHNNIYLNNIYQINAWVSRKIYKTEGMPKDFILALPVNNIERNNNETEAKKRYFNRNVCPDAGYFFLFFTLPYHNGRF